MRFQNGCQPMHLISSFSVFKSEVIASYDGQRLTILTLILRLPILTTLPTLLMKSLILKRFKIPFTEKSKEISSVLTVSIFTETLHFFCYNSRFRFVFFLLFIKVNAPPNTPSITIAVSIFHFINYLVDLVRLLILLVEFASL
jgi:hypothetical protein